jgi:hypothetical protein
MNTENYEQVALSDEELGDSAQWLSPGLKLQAEFYEGSPIGIDMPPSIELTVTQTEPSLKVQLFRTSTSPQLWRTASRSRYHPSSMKAIAFAWIRTKAATLNERDSEMLSRQPGAPIAADYKSKPCT